MKYDVFISYSSHDQKIVEGLCAYLEQHKIRCFVAYRDIPRGVVWARAIVDALDESRMMLVVFSEHFNNSDQVDREIELASEDKKPILTFRISDETFKGAKKYYLKNLNWIDAFPDPQAVFGDVAINVAKLLSIKLDADLKESKVKEPKTIRRATSVDKSNVEVQPKSVVTAYKIGDIYDVGGKQGVVFEVTPDGKHGKIVSLDEKKFRWCSAKQYDNNIRTDALSFDDGKYNTDIVMSRVDRSEYPAFVWCRKKGADWYMPAINELSSLYNARKVMNKNLKTKLLPIISLKNHWSSTDYNGVIAWCLFMSGGYASDGYYKDSCYVVRAVSTF